MAESHTGSFEIFSSFSGNIRFYRVEDTIHNRSNIDHASDLQITDLSERAKYQSECERAKVIYTDR